VQRLGLAAAALVAALPSSAATSVSGPIVADTVWRAQDGPFDVTGDVIVRANATLTVEAGVKIYMRPSTDLIVEQGALRTLGTAAAPVLITSQRDQGGDTPAPGDWGQLRFLDGTRDANTALEHTQVRYGSGVVIEAASPALNNVTISGHAAPAITIDLASSPAGSGNRAFGNALNGILLPSGDILGSARWRLRGIPFVIPDGTVGVGAPPAITEVTPAQIEQGGTTEAIVRGARLSGAESVRVLRDGVQAQLLPGGTDTAIPVRLTAEPTAALGPGGIEAQVAAGKATLDAALTVVLPLPALTVSGYTPDSLRRGESRSFAVSGSNLLGVGVSVASGSGLTVSNLQSTDNQLTFTLAASADAPLGTAVLSVANPGGASGQADLDVTVRKALPKLVVTPNVLAVPPDNVTRQFRVGLSDTDDEDHALTLTVGDATVAAISPLSVTIPVGQSQAAVSIRGLAQGQSSLTVSSPGLTAVNAVVYVSAQFESINTAYGATVGVARDAPPGAAQRQAGPLPSPAVGVSTGRHISEVTPATLIAGSGPVNLVVRGAGLEGVSAVTIVPNTGLTLGGFTVAADGSSVGVPVTVAADAPATLRQVVLAGAGAPYPVLRPHADRVRVALAAPQIESIEPVLLRQGATAALTIRGRNLSGVQAITITPPEGIAVDDSPSVGQGGTSLTVRVGAAATAAPGERVVRVITGGGSTPLAGAANTLHVLAQGQQIGQINALTGAAVGVAKDVPPQPAAAAVALTASVVGVNIGPGITSRAPASGAVGERVTLAFRGATLSAVTAVELLPATGVSIGAPQTSADGTSVTVTIDIATDAPLTVRALRVRAGAADVPFSDPAQAQFRITLPQPRIESITPNVVAIGSTARLTVRGANFPGASVRLAPADAVNVSSSVTIVSASELAVDVTVTAAAAPGPRVLIVATPAGETSEIAAATNTVVLATSVGPPITPLASANVGVEKPADSGPPATRDADRLAAGLVGIAVGPVALSVHAPELKPLTSGAVTITGIGLDQVTQVKLIGAGGVTLANEFQVSAAGTMLTVGIGVDGDPAGGLRQIELLDANGRAIAFASPPAAALQVQPGKRFSLLSANVGVAREPSAAAGTQSALLAGTQVGVAVGAIAVSVEPPPLYPGAAGTLLITGTGLDAVASVSLTGPAGATAGAPQVSAGGTELRVELSVAAGAAAGLRGIVLNGVGAAVPFLDPGLAQIRIATGQPSIESIDPIFWTAGETFPLTVRGQHLGQPQAVKAVGADGVRLADVISVSADGTALTVRVHVSADAPPTDQGYVQVITPGGASAATRSFANGFSIVR
jgi:hypothetical protein